MGRLGGRLVDTDEAFAFCGEREMDSKRRGGMRD